MKTTIFVLLVVLGLSSFAVAQEKGVNLYLCTRPGWSHPVVPRIGPYGTPTNCWVDDVLAFEDFYLNAHGRNAGDTPTPGGFDVAFYLDGQYATLGSAPVTSNEFSVLNLGPFSPDFSGRHTVSAYVDAFHSITETNEDDNAWGGQFMWPGRDLSFDGIAVVYPAPPPPEGGWEHCPNPELLFPNCDGYTLGIPAEGWVAVSVRPLDTDSQYTTSLFELNDDYSTWGYSNPLDSHDSGDGELVGFVINGSPLQPPWAYNVGVINNGGNGDYRIQTHIPQTLEPDVEFTQEFGPDQEMALWKFSLPPEHQGAKNLILETTSAHPMQLGYMNHYFEYGDVGDCQYGVVPTSPMGKAYKNLNITDDEENGVVVYMDTAEVTETFSFKLKLVDPIPNLIPCRSMYWNYPVVPTNSYTSPTAYLPGTLWGDSNTTYMNYFLRNDSDAGTVNFLDLFALDGVTYPPTLHLGGLAGLSYYSYQQINPVNVTGGRHTLSLKTDSGYSVTEIVEKDNNFAAQYCWRPIPFPCGDIQTLPAPPVKNGGHSWAIPGTEMLDNCSALRLSAFDPFPGEYNWWRGVAIIPAADCDIDLDLFAEYSGSLTSFATPLRSSESESGLTDFVLANMISAPDRTVPFEVGFTREVGEDSFVAQSVASQYVAFDPSGWYGDWTLASGEIMQMQDYFLYSGTHTIRLDNLTGDGLLGFSILSNEVPYLSLTSEVGKIVQSCAGTNGEDILVTVEVPYTGHYGFAIWKQGTPDLNKEINYRLGFDPGLSNAENVLVTKTYLSEAYPNPFNPCTTLSFGQKKTGHTRISLFDMRGRLVKVLCDGEFSEGEHQVVWRGDNESGSQVPSGVYLARMENDGAVLSRRMTLLR